MTNWPPGARPSALFEVSMRARRGPPLLDDVELDAARVRIGRAITAGQLEQLRKALVEEAAVALAELSMLPWTRDG